MYTYPLMLRSATRRMLSRPFQNVEYGEIVSPLRFTHMLGGPASKCDRGNVEDGYDMKGLECRAVAGPLQGVPQVTMFVEWCCEFMVSFEQEKVISNADG